MRSFLHLVSWVLLLGACACTASSADTEPGGTGASGGNGAAGGSGASGGSGGTAGSAGAPTFPDLPALDPTAKGALQDATHLVTVVTDAWTAVPATLSLYTRSGSTWERTLGPFDAVVGSAGLSWGRGLTQPPADAERVKKEGDKTAPAGLFRFGTVMGYDMSPPAGLTLPYRQATPDLVCVDDSMSAHYNTIQSTPAMGPPEWSSSEPMLRPDNLYEVLGLIDHNALVEETGAVPQGGSCIFLHVWSGLGSSTVGCTALDHGELTNLLVALPSLGEVVLAQLPRDVYAEAVLAWGLPE